MNCKARTGNGGGDSWMQSTTEAARECRFSEEFVVNGMTEARGAILEKYGSLGVSVWAGGVSDG